MTKSKMGLFVNDTAVQSLFHLFRMVENYTIIVLFDFLYVFNII